MNKEDLLHFDNLINMWIDHTLGSRERELAERETFVNNLKNIMNKDKDNE